MSPRDKWEIEMEGNCAQYPAQASYQSSPLRLLFVLLHIFTGDHERKPLCLQKRQTAVVFKENWTNVPLLFSSVSLCHFTQDIITWKRFKTKNQNQKVQARKFCNWHLGAVGFRITKVGVTVGAGLGLMRGLCWS